LTSECVAKAEKYLPLLIEGLGILLSLDWDNMCGGKAAKLAKSSVEGL
jgi:hypothetical protein